MSNKNKISKLSEDELKRIKDEVFEGLTVIRHSLLLKFPFIGNLLLHLDLVPVRDKRVRTACTDGKSIYFDLEFYKKLNTRERSFVLAHELFHCVLLHLVRQQMRNPVLFNIATDMEVNYCLKLQSSNNDLVPPSNLCFPPKSMEGKSAEVIYDWLLKKANKQSKSGKNSKNNSSSSKDNSSSSSFSSSSNSSFDEDLDDGSLGSKNGSESGNLEGQFDNHDFSDSVEDENGSSSSNKVEDQWGEVGFDSDFKPKISSDFADRMREAVISEAQRCQRTQGHLPAGLEFILDQMPKPEVNWKEELSTYVSSIPNGKYVWLPPNRRHIYNDVYLQSRRSEKIKVAALVDTSGSCTGDLGKFFSELNSLLKSFGSYELTVIQVDADVQDVHKYSDEEPFPIDDLKSFKFSGGGGSDLRPAFEKMRVDGIENEVDSIIVLTDGYIDFPKYPPSKPVLIVLTSDGDKECCDWGKKIVFKSDQ